MPNKQPFNTGTDKTPNCPRQLRDLICFADNDPQALMTVTQHSILQFDPTGKREGRAVLSNLPFSPTTLSAARGYLAVGGQRGQLVACRRLPGDNWRVQANFGGAINNTVLVSHHHGRDKVLVCNNDETIRIFLLPTMDLQETLSFPVAINHGREWGSPPLICSRHQSQCTEDGCGR